MTQIPRQEYPRPQMVRRDFLNLNGLWEFEIDNASSGKARGLPHARHLTGSILVPFCPESRLSGVGVKDFMPCVWYRREVVIPHDWMEAIRVKGERLILHFGAVDYQATVYIGGSEVCSHKGGYSAFSADITAYVNAGGTAVITVCAEDDVRTGKQPGGKQSGRFDSYECFYTRTTGIWQTVWLEKVPAAHIKSFRIYPDIENGRVRITAKVTGQGTLTASAFYGGKAMGKAGIRANNGLADVILALDETHLWEQGAGRLYDLQLEFGEDHIDSYFGLRSVRMEGMKFLLNGRPVFQRLVLDQGYYPDGIYTAPSEAALVRDIELSMAAGFNGARLHQKAFEPRFLYHCDRLGYMVWGEQGNWGLDVSEHYALAAFLPEWTELVERDFNHPAVIGWCPFNETWDEDGRRQRDEVIGVAYSVTKQLDPTRPCIDTSGNYHVATDIFDLHDYDQNPKTFRQRYDDFRRGEIPEIFGCGQFRDGTPRQRYGGEPVFISEYGGIKWEVDGGAAGWGYGTGPKTEEEFLDRYRGLTLALLENEKIFGFCYTQLYDVEQEKNGLYTYRREPKFDMEVIRAVNMTPAAIERSL